MVEQLKNGNTKINDMSKKEPWGFCETPEEKCTMNYCDDNGCQNRKRNPTESHSMVIMDMSQLNIPEPSKMKKYEIWIGLVRAWGQGDHDSTEPQKLGEVEATSFKIACCIYEHQSHIDTLKMRMERGDKYIEDAWFGYWGYNPKDNSTMHLGKYYETREEALESFK